MHTMTGSKVLIVTTSHAEMGSTGHKTGVWLEELATPYYALLDGGAEVTLASIKGGQIPFDPRSVPAEAGQSSGEEPAEQQEIPASVRRFLGDERAMAAARNSPAVEKVAGEPFDAVFLPGGHGTMWDLPGSDTLALLVGSYFDDNRIVSAVCHGPAGLVSAKRADGGPIVEGRRVAGFTNSEEEGVGLAQVVPFLLEDRLKELGGRYEKGADWQPFVVRDGNLITGKNPQSSEQVAHEVLTALGLGLDPAILEEIRIRERAYAIWEQEGYPHGRHEEHWMQAREEMTAGGGDGGADTGLGEAAAALRGADAASERPGKAARTGAQTVTHIEGASGDGTPTFGGAGTSGDLKTPQP
jgi:putative intracellular protease/amidase